VAGLLGDQAYGARALLDAAEVTGDSSWLDRAIELAEFIVERFAHRDGDGKVAGFFDVWDEVAGSRSFVTGRSRSRTTACARVFIRLHHLTRDERLCRLRGDARAFVSAIHRWGTSPPGCEGGGYAPERRRR
jgi:uncharacterized protein YyaL (SSP411 family)